MEISTKHADRVRPDVEHALEQNGVTCDLRRSSPSELMYEVTVPFGQKILAATGLAVALGLHLPLRLHWRDLVVVALATSGGFTFGLFFATAVFPVGPILAELKIGAVATGIGVPLAFAAARLLHAGRFGRHAHHARPARSET